MFRQRHGLSPGSEELRSRSRKVCRACCVTYKPTHVEPDFAGERVRTGDLFGLRDSEMPLTPHPGPSGTGVISRALMAEVGHFVREIPFCGTW